MSSITGFGTVKGTINTNRPKLVCRLKSGKAMHITSIAGSYTLPTGNDGPTTSFEAGMITILRAAVDSDNTFSPDPKEIAAWRSGAGLIPYLSELATPIWEHRWSGPNMSFFGYFGERGILLQPDQDYSVILARPSIDAGSGSPPNIITTVGVLSVSGWVEDAENPFGTLR